MPIKKVDHPEFGQIILAKRRGAKNLRLSVSAEGQVRVGLPLWTPYHSGLRFLNMRRDWVVKQMAGRPTRPISHGDKIGKSHTVVFRPASTSKLAVRTTVTADTINIFSNMPAASAEVQERATVAAERALSRQASIHLLNRTNELAKRYGYSYRQLKIKKLRSRWGSCSSKKNITLSLYLMQLPEHLIDYVILHELAHTKELNHGSGFWKEMTDILPDVAALRAELKRHNPAIVSQARF